jgi:hypothetical protein
MSGACHTLESVTHRSSGVSRRDGVESANYRRRIFVPSSSGARSGSPHDSQSTANIELNGAEQEGHRRKIAPPHCAHCVGTWASNCSNQR